MPIKDLHKIEQPREKLEKYGVSKLSNEELLAILLRTGPEGTGVLDLAKQIFKKFQGTKLADTNFEELEKVHGLGPAKASEIVACFELGRRLLQNKKSALLLSPQDVWDQLKDIRDNKKEHFVIFFLDSRNQEIKREVVSIGSLNANLVHPREVFEPAVRHLAAQVIIAHNHPAGDPSPSQEDSEITKQLVEAGKLLGIDVKDHVIVSKTNHFSFKEHKLL